MAFDPTTVETTTYPSVTEYPLDNTVIPGYSEKSENTRKDIPSDTKPTFFPRRTTSRFNFKSEQSRRTTTSSTTEATTTQLNRFSSNLRRRPTFERRRLTTSSSTAEPNTTEAENNTTTTRPKRLYVRKYFSQRSGANNGTTTQRPLSSTVQTSETTSRRSFRVGLRRRLSTTRSTTTIPSTTVGTQPATDATESDKIHNDQESHSTIQQSQEKDSSAELVNKKVIKIQKRPLSTFKNNQFVSQDDLDESNESLNKNSEENPTKEKKYSSVIKQDKTLVQTEKHTEEQPKDVNLEEIGGDVTAAVAVAAHQLLSAPLPTIPSYALDDESDSSSSGEIAFTRAYLMASTSPPIINPNDFTQTTQYPKGKTKYNFQSRGRRISTTIAPQIIYSSSVTPSIVRRRKPQPPLVFEKINPVTKTYRTFIDYEYYDDDDVRVIDKSPVKGKVVLHGTGVIQCLDQGNFPHPESCKKFISCAKMENGGVYGWAYTCPKGLSFDPVGGICNWSAGLGCKEH